MHAGDDRAADGRVLGQIARRTPRRRPKHAVSANRGPAPSSGTGNPRNARRSSSGGRTAASREPGSRHAGQRALSTATSATHASTGPASSSSADPWPGSAAPGGEHRQARGEQRTAVAPREQRGVRQ